MKEVNIYTDGACRGNPGPGGYGVVMLYGEHRKELAAGYRKTTNNRMELLATIVALEALKAACKVTLYSDSRYVVESMTKGWVKNWEAKGWVKKQNVDLWKLLLVAVKKHQVNFVWVKGHSTNVENNRCDELAVEAATSADLAIDEGYEEKLSQENAQDSLFEGE